MQPYPERMKRELLQVAFLILTGILAQAHIISHTMATN